MLIVWVLIVLVIIAAVYLYFRKPYVMTGPEDVKPLDESVTPTVEIGEGMAALRYGTTTVFLQVADDDAERALGLGQRDSLGQGIDGMLFILPNASQAGIWMKDMRFSIDIIWLDQDFKIVDIAKRVSPNTYPQTFTPRTPANYVVELAAGKSDMLGLKINNGFTLRAWRP